MPIRKKDYPPDWPAISLAVREAANWRCQWCDAPNGRYILRTEGATHLAMYRTIQIGETKKKVRFGDFTEVPDKHTGSVKIILTVAHLDRDRSNNDLSNLAALCQRCHLNHDRTAQHLPHRKYGRYHDREHQGKLKL